MASSGRDRGEKKPHIAGVVKIASQGCSRARLWPEASAAASELQVFVSDVVGEGAKVWTNGLTAYNGPNAVFRYEFKMVRDPRIARHKFPRIHRADALFKRELFGTYRGS